MTGTVPHLQLEFADRDSIVLVQPSIGREALARREAEHAGLSGHLLDPEQIVLMRPLDRQRTGASEFSRCTGVIEMGVRDQDLLERDLQLLDLRQHPIEITARIDDRGPTRALAAQDGAVLLEGRDRNDAKFHPRMIGDQTVMASPR